MSSITISTAFASLRSLPPQRPEKGFTQPNRTVIGLDEAPQVIANFFKPQCFDSGYLYGVDPCSSFDNG